MANNSVYTSQQYQILLDLSGLMTAAMTDSIFERTVANSLSTKLDRDQQFLFLTPNKEKRYSTAVSAAGIEIVNTSNNYISPSIKLDYLVNEKYTFDQLCSLFNPMNINDPSGYAKHYMSGTLPSLKLDITEDIPTITILKETLNKHNDYTNSHQNLNNLQYYYNKSSIDIKETNINNNLILLQQKLTKKEQSDIKVLEQKIIKHENALDSHQDINKLKNYCLKTIHDTDIQSLQQNLQNHNINTAAHNDIRTLITNNTNLVNQFKKEYTAQHTGELQTSIHDMLIAKNNPYTNSSYFIINTNNNSYDSAYINIKNKNFKNNNINFSINLNNNQNVQFKNYSTDYDGQIIFSQYNTAGSLLHSIKLMDNNGNSQLLDVTANNIKLKNYQYPGNTDLTQATSKQWVMDYINQYVNNVFLYNPYDAMADYANATKLCTANNDKIYKINVPGYIYFYTGHCSDCDMTIYASYNPSNLSPFNKDYVVKLSECFGYNDRDQSIINLQIYPGTQTYLLLSNDNNSSNIGAAYWVFIPALGVRHITTNHNKYVTFISETSKSHKAVNTQPKKQIYEKIFNTSENSNIWQSNFTNWS